MDLIIFNTASEFFFFFFCKLFYYNIQETGENFEKLFLPLTFLSLAKIFKSLGKRSYLTIDQKVYS